MKNNPQVKGCLVPKLELEAVWLEELRGPAPNAAFARLYKTCLDWVLRDRGRLAEDECLDVVSDSLLDELDTLLSTTRSPEDVAGRLQQALDRRLRQRRRSARRIQEYKKLQSALTVPNRPEEGLDAEQLIEMARFLKGFIGIAIESLPDREYALLYELYDLERFGFKRRAMETQPDLSAKDRQVLAFQARASFLAELNRLMIAAGSALHYDRRVVQEALQFVRSNNPLPALAADDEPQP